VTVAAPHCERRIAPSGGQQLNLGETSLTTADLVDTAGLPSPILAGAVGSIFCDSSVAERHELERIFVAYGGRLLSMERSAADDGKERRHSTRHVVFVSVSSADAERARDVVRLALPGTDERVAVVVTAAWLSACVRSRKFHGTLPFIAPN
jgi:hypothetical protein